MKKGSGFEKFFKSKEKTGAAKKEEFRQEKKQFKKEREEKIAIHKREKRAQYKASFSNEPPKYNLDPPGKKFVKKGVEDRAQKPPFKSGQKKIELRPKSNPNQNNQRPNSNYQKPASNQGQKLYKKEGSVQVGKKAFAQKNIIHKGSPNVGGNQPSVPKKPITINKPLAANELMPLNKYIAHSGVCSRRDAVGLIKGGKVKVNGELILEPGHKVTVLDDVRVAGRKLNPVKDFVYILLNKPKDYITTTDDPQERKTVLDLLKGAPPIRIYPVGRLDRNTSGVLLLTNDGDLAQSLTHPSNEIKKVYAVTLDKPLTKAHFEAILKGVPLEDGVANVDSLAFADGQDLTQLGIELHSGRNRIVRRIFEHLGYDIKALDRVIFAGLTKKNVDRGKWRYLAEKEVRDLKFFKKGRS
jgi:23S rRNA pseudouridine2605 synthase